MPNIADEEFEPDEEPCGIKDRHPAHDWSSQVLDRGPDDYITLRCPGVRKMYKLTEEEFVRFVIRHDDIAIEFGTEYLVQLIKKNPHSKINLGYGGVTYDPGENWFWVDTRDLGIAI